MDENRRIYDKRYVLKPRPFFSAKVDEHFNVFDEDNPKPDYRVREGRDIDDKGVFFHQRIQ
jgi:hypothetical protein